MHIFCLRTCRLETMCMARKYIGFCTTLASWGPKLFNSMWICSAWACTDLQIRLWSCFEIRRNKDYTRCNQLPWSSTFHVGLIEQGLLCFDSMLDHGVELKIRQLFLHGWSYGSCRSAWRGFWVYLKDGGEGMTEKMSCRYFTISSMKTVWLKKVWIILLWFYYFLFINLFN